MDEKQVAIEASKQEADASKQVAEATKQEAIQEAINAYLAWMIEQPEFKEKIRQAQLDYLYFGTVYFNDYF